jgi:GNAT superfamily N-acetyltransferase
MNSELTYRNLVGAGITSVFEPLADLRITVFRSFPYLYEGSLDYELHYLKTYANSPQALLFAVFDGDRMVGATTALPLADETEEVRAPFVNAGYRVEDVFYFGESILLPAYRGLGIGHRFFDERENHARSFGTFKYTSFCAVQRSEEHPERPADYQPLDGFWKNEGTRPCRP